MTNKPIHINDNIQSLIDQWMLAEQQGEQFPVDFDVAWQIAGYSTKSTAKNKGLKKLERDIDFSTIGLKSSTGGRSSEVIKMTCDGLKHFCLMAKTEQGKNIRKYFIEAEKKWKMVQQADPQLAQQIELARLQQQAAEANKRAAIAQNQAGLTQQKLLDTVQAMETFCPGLAPLALGKQDAIVERREYVERVIDKNTGRVTEGVGITYLSKKFGFKNTKQCWAWLESIGYGKDSGFWEAQLYAGTAYKLPPEEIKNLQKLFKHGDRQLFLGE